MEIIISNLKNDIKNLVLRNIKNELDEITKKRKVNKNVDWTFVVRRLKKVLQTIVDNGEDVVLIEKLLIKQEREVRALSNAASRQCFFNYFEKYQKRISRKAAKVLADN